MAGSLIKRNPKSKLILPVLILGVIFILFTLITSSADKQKKITDKDDACKILRIENNKIYLTTPNGEEQSFDIAPIDKAVPYYRIFRSNLNFGLIKSWPPDVIRRLIFDCKFEIDEYVSAPSQEAYYNLTNTLDKIIQQANSDARFNPKWYQNAIDTCKQTLRVKPKDADMYFLLGMFYCQMDNYKDAIDAFKQAIRIKPDTAENHYNLGLAYLFCGDRGSALNQYKILKDLDGDLAKKLFNLISKQGVKE